MSIETITEEALKLPAEERARLADTLVESLDPVDDPHIRQAWEQEIERRIVDVESGRSKTVPAEEVFAEIRASLNPAR
jgi:putative addiction module component (TIGR02574 family)